MDRLYRDKNYHYFIVEPEEIYIECDFCHKKYTFDECEIINKKTGEPYSNELGSQLLPAVT